MGEYDGPYKRVTIRELNGKNKSFWAKRLSKSKGWTLYLRLNVEGDDFARYDKNDRLVVPQELVQNTVIIKEVPAYMSKRYGTLSTKKER